MELARRGIAISAFMLLSAGLCLGQSLGEFARQDLERRSKLAKHAAVITNEDLDSARQSPSLGEIARQERERRSKLAKHAPVITNEDLANDRIFSAPPATEQAATGNTGDARPQVTTAPAADIPLWGVAEQAGFSLGEYARTLREQRRRQEQRTELTQRPEAPPAATPVAIPGQRRSPTRRQPQTSASQVEQVPATAQPRIAPAPGPRLIRVERGDSLWKLARRHFGEGRLWTLLWQANPEIRRPNRLSVGQMLRQPSDELLALHRILSPAEAGSVSLSKPTHGSRRGLHILARASRADLASGRAEFLPMERVSWRPPARMSTEPHKSKADDLFPSAAKAAFLLAR